MAFQKRPVILIMGAPEWMVTFGDMMSLLLTFFILLFSVAQVKDSGKVMEIIFALQGMAVGRRPVHGFLLPDYNTIVDDLRVEAEKKSHFGESGVHSKRVVDSEGDGFYSLRIRDQLKIVIEGSVFFDEGDWHLRQEGSELLEKKLAPRFRDGPFRIVVRGHAVRGEVPTVDAEDDLGYRRAREVRDFLVKSGIPPSRFELQTVGSRSDPVTDEPGADEKRALERKVEISVSPQAVSLPVEGE